MNYRILYTAKAVRLYKKLPRALQKETKDTLYLLSDSSNHKELRVHKLKGRLRSYYSASINYSHRIVFLMKGSEITVLAIGSHDIYT